MKFAAAVVFSLSASVAAFSPASLRHQPRTTLSLHATLADKPALVREAPGAGYVPEWEDRPGLTQEEFLRSDISKPDLSEMYECPLTRWNAEGYVNG